MRQLGQLHEHACVFVRVVEALPNRRFKGGGRDLMTEQNNAVIKRCGQLGQRRVGVAGPPDDVLHQT